MRAAGQWRDHWRQRGRSRLWLTGAAILSVVLFLVWASGNPVVMEPIRSGLARITGVILGALGHRVIVSGNTVGSELFGISVITACTGLFTTGLFLIAVVAYPTRWASKLLGSAIGIGGILVLNVVRLVSLYYIGVHLPGFLNTAHQLIWQSLLILFSVVLWLLWAGRWAHAARAS